MVVSVILIKFILSVVPRKAFVESEWDTVACYLTCSVYFQCFTACEVKERGKDSPAPLSSSVLSHDSVVFQFSLCGANISVVVIRNTELKKTTVIFKQMRSHNIPLVQCNSSCIKKCYHMSSWWNINGIDRKLLVTSATKFLTSLLRCWRYHLMIL